MVKDNQDHFKRGGRSGGPRGSRAQHKQQLTRGRAAVRGETEGRSGKRAAPVNATEEAEAQLGALHESKEHEHHESVLDRLPKPVGAAGVPRSARPVPTASEAEAHHEAHEPRATGRRTETPADFFGRDVREEEAPFGYGIPASEDSALGGSREPFERERGEMRHAAREGRRLSPVQRRLVKTFPPLFRAVGSAARAVERPIREALDTLQWLGRAARKSS